MNLENTDAFELKDRFNTLVEKYKELAPEVAKKLEEFGRIRKEMFILIEEFKKRGIDKEIEELKDEYKK